ncbi:ribosomal rna methyltransferase [Nannochloropsis gaditana]|uniref:Ribosomal rna methyltransferase n=1 Tax=Nannochloropsis gaditana TaxID=72520 RepID=W7TGG7_9STRA|nr:ribosomal rna methyltransferase [Nannochloropsis gaditana]
MTLLLPPNATLHRKLQHVKPDNGHPEHQQSTPYGHFGIRITKADSAAINSTQPIVLTPLFPFVWACEVGQSQVHRLLSYLPTASFPSTINDARINVLTHDNPTSSPGFLAPSCSFGAVPASNAGSMPSSPPDLAPIPRTNLRKSNRIEQSTPPLAGCIADRSHRHASCLLGANYRLDDPALIPLVHRRYITRFFYVPYACRDMGWVAFSPELRQALKTARSSLSRSFCLKISAFPKNMEVAIGEILLTAPVAQGCRLEEKELSPSASQASHVLHVVHSPEWSPLFYYGLTQSHSLTGPTSAPPPSFLSFLPPSFEKPPSSSSLPPVSRAYFKMREIWEERLEEGMEGGMEEEMWKKDRKALDVGASPGGWTQYLRYNSRGRGGREKLRRNRGL